MEKKSSRILLFICASVLLIGLGFIIFKQVSPKVEMSGLIPEKVKVAAVRNDRLLVQAQKEQYTVVMIGIYTPDNSMKAMTEYLNQYIGKTVYLEKDTTDKVNGIYPRYVWLTPPDVSKLNSNCLNAILLGDGRAMVNAKQIEVDPKYSNVFTALTQYAADKHLGLYSSIK